MPEIGLSFIKKIMLNQGITKVFHSCRQNIESLLTVFKCIPTSFFDTQVAAKFCHYYHDFIGYLKVVEQYQARALDKIKAKNSDWLSRPLSEDELDYAVNDVVHLYDLYQILCNKLEENNRMGWFQEDMESIVDINMYLHSPKDAWKRIKFHYEVNPRLILTVKAVSKWQETLTQRFNMNRNKMINNAVIADFIEKNVEHVDEILDDLKRNTKNIKDADLLEFVNIFNENERNWMQQNNTLSSNYDKSVFDILSIILDSKCKESNISRKLVSSKDESVSQYLDRQPNYSRGGDMIFLAGQLNYF